MVNKSHKDLFKTIHRSQHVQRNWDLDAEMPQEDVDIILESVTQCPSKQNASFYKVHVLQDRDIIEKLHLLTEGFGIGDEKQTITTNSQTLAHLVLVFEAANTEENGARIVNNYEYLRYDYDHDQVLNEVMRDREMAVGVAAGYANLTASLMGYGTGCCACFNPTGVAELLGLEDSAVLIMGIGVPGKLPRRVHHKDHDIVFPSKKKQPIDVIVH